MFLIMVVAFSILIKVVFSRVPNHDHYFFLCVYNCYGSSLWPCFVLLIMVIIFSYVLVTAIDYHHCFNLCSYN
jgi:ABC-type transport system involved in Fe-S cluster assembly fused permease/ATPase subunit